MTTLSGLEVTRSGQPGGVRRFTVIEPATGEWLADVPVCSTEAVREAVARARAAQGRWASQPLELRCEQVLKLRDALVDRSEEIIDLLVRESGKPRQEALVHEVMVAADLAGYYAKRATKILAPCEIEPHLFRHRRSYVHYVPRGVVAIISPASHPFVIGAGEMLTAMIAGNAVVLKPSELAPLVALKLKEIFDASGMPRDLLEVVTGDASTGEALIEAQPDMLFFTGSQANGRRVAAACGERLIPCTLQLSGKAAAIVCEDADLERAARSIVYGAFANCGQVCIRVDRVYAHASIFDALVRRVCTLAEQLRIGNPSSQLVDVGPLRTAAQLELADAFVQDAVARGAAIRCGGKRRSAGGHYFEPTVLAPCSPEMRVMREELLAPVLPMMAVAREEDAIVETNQSRYGVMGYVFSRDRVRARRIAERLQAGTVMINDVLAAYASPELPYGGVKDSGIGRVHGDDGLRAMCETRSVDYNRGPMFKREPVWFPYRKRTYATMDRLMRVFMRSGSRLKNAIDLL